MKKTCTECGQTKPRNSTYFHRKRESEDGLTTRCKVCLNRLHKKHNRPTPKLPFLHPVMQAFLRNSVIPENLKR